MTSILSQKRRSNNVIIIPLACLLDECRGISHTQKLLKSETNKYFLVDVWLRTSWEPRCTQIIQTAESSVNVPRPHVFCGVNSESCDTPTDELVHEVSSLISNPRSSSFQITKTGQTTVTHLDSVVVVLVQKRLNDIHPSLLAHLFSHYFIINYGQTQTRTQ